MLFDEEGYDYEGEEIEEDETLFAIENNFPQMEIRDKEIQNESNL